MSDKPFKALVLRQVEGKTTSMIEELTLAQLPRRDVLIQVDYSSLNYKDALAVTGAGKIVREFPMVPGIDLCGVVVESDSARYTPGDKVILTGWGVGEQHWGGYSQYQRVSSEWLVPLPIELDSRQAMAVGTAGFTAMLCVMALEDAGVTRDSGDILVTGAAGGVGSVAVAILAKRGYRVTGLISAAQQHEAAYVRELGAVDVVSGPEWSTSPKPLEVQRWAAAIDVVGARVLERVLSQMHYGGTVAVCGLAGGSSLNTTMMPFILRGVRLLGIDSVMCPISTRTRAWQRVVADLPRDKGARITTEIALDEVPHHAGQMLDGKLRGRAVVNLKDF
jgi:acrylyl-CoA reductase (NADPH)